MKNTTGQLREALRQNGGNSVVEETYRLTVAFGEIKTVLRGSIVSCISK
jgi:hypothetical protein